MQPTVSIIIPCYNEEATIHHLLDAIFAQTYPREKIEVVIADGISIDSTRAQIDAFQKQHADLALKIVDNISRTIPSALNLSIRSSNGEIIVRLDAHSAPIPEYVQRCVDALQAGKGANVGGIWQIKPGAQTWIAQSIAIAAAHPLGVGDAMYRLNASAGAVDTVPFGSFHRSLIEKIGGFDEALLANEDYEFNTRVRQSGGVVWLDPAIRSTYFSRSTLFALAKQYYRYGFWKYKMLQRYPNTIKWRQALPPVFTVILYTLLIMSVFIPFTRFLLALQLTLYFGILTFAAVQVVKIHRKLFLVLGLPLAIATMHIAWGSGFLSSIFVRKNG